MNLYIISSKNKSSLLEKTIIEATAGLDVVYVDQVTDEKYLQNKKILFAIELNEIGICEDALKFVRNLYRLSNKSLLGSSASLIIKSNSDLYTKNFARDMVFLLNNLGCSFMGQPLVEMTKDLKNLYTFQKKFNIPLPELSSNLCKNTIDRLMCYNPKILENPHVLALHSSNYKTSNTLTLWNLIKSNLNSVSEYHVENGTILDCIGCAFKTCKHYSKQSSCFYGGTMVKEIYPAIEAANGLVFLCPNYNDALSANISAVINRLTALYRRSKFYDKSLFSIVVSGNSGSDIVAKQLISALNLNKGFRLPPYFSLMYTANDPGSILKYSDVDIRAKEFANHILMETKS
ncbi:MAG: NAD(P)H-dependent oxidoreductase [Anaeromicrobium sp.]|jgi:multimeric flavodoxin WrbA|uniref:flavodoxin family protein n=1 Tax=Anaeromicrobium sp. TaxID=1929132 RepID=UPI0025DAAF46|nr:NAD(P)H-dependent oxidoreductase [Anaeromicrobium sp.]MCT4595203.1 NAD(P)H-dependent oxidoreductase [Anaeromicrobium sp.]